MWEASGCGRLVGLRGSGRLVGVKNREASGCGRLVGAGGYWSGEASVFQPIFLALLILKWL